MEHLPQKANKYREVDRVLTVPEGQKVPKQFVAEQKFHEFPQAINAQNG